MPCVTDSSLLQLIIKNNKEKNPTQIYFLLLIIIIKKPNNKTNIKPHTQGLTFRTQTLLLARPLPPKLSSIYSKVSHFPEGVVLQNQPGFFFVWDAKL